MRRSCFGKLPNPTLFANATKPTLPFSIYSSSSSAAASSAFSTTPGGGGSGRGRGRGSSDPPNFPFTTPGNTNPPVDESSNFPSSGHGRGGNKLPFPSFSSIIPGVNNNNNYNNTTTTTTTNTSRGHGRGTATTPPPQHPGAPKKPIFFLKEENPDSIIPKSDRVINPEDTNLPSRILSVLSPGGAGRGKPEKLSNADETKIEQENRHIRPRETRDGSKVKRRVGESSGDIVTPTPRLSREEAVKKAVDILSRRSGGEEGEGGRGKDGVKERVKPYQAGRRPQGGRRDQRKRFQDAEEGNGPGMDLGDGTQGEELAKRVGSVVMNKLVEGFEEISSEVLPSPFDDEFVEGFHTNMMFECEEEYLMEEFGTNPDIDEKPPISLRDALEKMKPFLMAYEGIQSHEEWEEVVQEAMERVPILKELVDYYSGPDRVTAKSQQEELERVAKTLPESAPSSVKRFTDRAVLSLQSNPGWGFDKKCQFMDKLVWEVSQHYK